MAVRINSWDMSKPPSDKKPAFSLEDVRLPRPSHRALFSIFRPGLERLFGLNQLSRLYDEFQRLEEDGKDPLEKILEFWQSSYSVSPDDLERIPQTGRAVVVSNHPFGGIEGVILGALLRSIRPDVKIMANFLLSRISELNHVMLHVDPFGTTGATKRNVSALRETIRILEQEQILGVFPAGTVSHLHWPEREVKDPPWSDTVVRLVRRTQSPVLPVFFHGRNGLLFQLLGLIHPRLRTAMLPNEFMNKRRGAIDISVGSLIPFEKIRTFEDDRDLLAYLRLRTYILGASGKTRMSAQKSIAQIETSRHLEPVASAVPTQLMVDEVNLLPQEQLLIESGEYQVFCARAEQIPNVIREIGRLRELTFRGVNEGTGRSSDLDQFDVYYTHLFCWQKNRREVVGAYRIGRIDEIVRKYGKNGLYTSTLFNYHPSVLKQLDKALELGRSFVRPEYQRSYSSLLLLWKGIGRYVVRNPQYKILFGSVSINNDYDSMSREIIVRFLQANDFLPKLARFVKPRNPLKLRPMRGSDPALSSVVVRDIQEVSELVDEIETVKRGIPVLLRQYLKLGGKLLGFNIDTSFGDVLDGLILVDLTKTDQKLLDRYLGKEGSQEFLRYHRSEPRSSSVNGHAM